MKKLYKTYVGILVSVVLVSMTITGCMAMGSVDIQPGIVTSLQTGGTLLGMREVIAQEVGTSIMTNGKTFILFWTREGQGYNFVALDVAKKLTIANFVELAGSQPSGITSYKTFSDVTNALKRTGFRNISVNDLPPALVTAIAASGSWLAQMASSMTTFVFIPIICESTVGNVCGMPVKTQIS